MVSLASNTKKPGNQPLKIDHYQKTGMIRLDLTDFDHLEGDF